VFHSLERDKDNLEKKQENLDRVLSTLTDSLQEMRELSAGLTLPELSTASLADVVNVALETHIERTRTKVTKDLATTPVHAPAFVNVCVYRFVQEALNNSFKHADGLGQHVILIVRGEDIEINVSDKGPGFGDNGRGKNTEMLGLLGMRDRIEAIGGQLDIKSRTTGCSLTACIALGKAQQLDTIDGNVTGNKTLERTNSHVEGQLDPAS